jgi:DNA-binding transcriptional regulator YhcF (GntR family)
VIVTVDHDSPTPAFEQLRVAIRRLVSTGALPVGARLPTVRQLAADLGLAPGTVVRAFRELEGEGIIDTRGRHGTLVRSVPVPPAPAEREQRIREAASTYAAVAAELVVPTEAALEHVRMALAETPAGRPGDS